MPEPPPLQPGSPLPIARQIPRVAMIQDGARRRYMVPVTLQRTGILDRVFIDWLVRTGSTEARIADLIGRFRPGLGRRMRERCCPELDPNRVVSNWRLSIRMQMRMRRIPVEEESFMYASHQTARWIRRVGFGGSNVLYGFIRNASPELFQHARRLGLRTAADQIIAPYQVEVNELAEQHRRWPDWSKTEATRLHGEYLKFEQQSWEHLDQITCMSDYVRQGLISVGVPGERVTVIPYPWNETGGPPPPRENRNRPLTVGFVGGVGLRKGAPYFLEVARRFDPRQVKFVMVGKVLLNPQQLGKYQDHVQFTGSVARSQVKDWLERFDVFFFPSTCEGSAGAVMEAMASGLPVLTSPNSGSAVRHGIDGFVHRYDEVDQFEAAIGQLDADRDLMHRMGASARARVIGYDLEAYGKDLNQFFTELVNPA